MPNRIIKESICTSDTIDELSTFEETFFYRLIVNCDDYGRFDARPKILKARLFPLKSDVRDDVIVESLRKLSLVGIAKVYIYDNRPYLQLTTWSDHQSIRNKKSKFPSLEDKESIEIDFTQFGKNKITCKTFENICNQLISSEYKCPRNPIQSESNPNPKDSSEQNAPEPPDEPEENSVDITPVISLTLNTGEDYEVLKPLYDYFVNIYPNVDVISELRKMKGWLDTNPKKRKTQQGIKRFINGWLAREQDKGCNKQGITVKSNSFNNMEPRKYNMAELEKDLVNAGNGKGE